ncbi:MAG TPA: type 2 lanthipeptide synthetase LanM family protein [Bryobacteraceae bacterium]|nr:type 2 lanthipeptide synthetase LanM family protein [Bryobacteraceae bacterium]
MTFHDLAVLVAASSSLYERIQKGFQPVSNLNPDSSTSQELARWKQIYRDKGPGAFKRRLALDGWTESFVQPYLGAVRLPHESDLPAWALTLRGCVNRMLESKPGDFLASGDESPQPRLFEHLFTPMVQFASLELRRRAGDKSRLLSTTALAGAELSLLDSLVQVSIGTLALEFQAFRSAREDTIFRILRRMKDQRSNELYRAFLVQMHAGGLLNLLSAYPVLGRFWGLLAELWIENLTEFLTRLDTDLPTLSRRLKVSSRRPAVANLRMNISDRHHGGRTVMLVVFSGERRVIYKPKGLGLEKAFFQLLSWLNREGSPVQLRGIEVIDRETYGWVEFADHRSCVNRDEVASYYRKAGGLLCIVHLLEGTDCHLENIVAARADPVLVDAETLLHHRVVRDRSGLESGFEAQDECWDSVFRTGMLPSWILEADGTPFDISGLGGFGEQASSQRVPHWDNINTDELQLRSLPGRRRPARNVPMLGETAQSPLAFESELIAGFSEMYRFCDRHKALLTARKSPVLPLGSHWSRYVARDTTVYCELRRGLLQPSALTSGIAQTLHLELLAAAHMANTARPEPWKIVRSEREALLQFDIPYFRARACSRDLELPDGKLIAGFFERASIERVLRKIAGTSPEDLRKQVRFIRASFFSRSVRTPHQRNSVSTLRRKDVPGTSAFRQAQFIAEAERIAEELRKDSARVNGTGAAWIGLDYRPESKRYHYQPVGNGLYSGRCGIGLFLAALWATTGETRWRELALGAVDGARRRITEKGWQVADASIAYAICRIGTFLADEDLLRDATKAAGRIGRGAIASDENLDVLFGTAGALLSFLALHKWCGDEAALAKAVACGRRLLLARVRTGTGHRAWQSRELPALTGFSHGAAGIAYALLKLFETTGQESFREAALEAIAFERAVFDAEAGNWPDFRSGEGRQGTRGFMTAWCNGATGIGLSRLGARLAIADGPVAQEIEAALRATRGYRYDDVDHLCCGSFGRIELLLTAGCQLHRPRLVAEARRWASVRIQQSERNGGYRVMHRLPRWVRNPGFYQGISGIGYQLLRLARPKDLPILLLWE